MIFYIAGENVNKVKLKRIVKYAGNIITILSIICIVGSIIKMDINVSKLPNKESVLLWSVLGIILTVISLFVLSYSWMQPFQWLGKKKINFLSVCTIYLKSNIGKYLPGNVAHYVERNLFAINIGVRQIYVAISSGLECIVLVITALVISILFSYKELVVVFERVGVLKWIKLVLIIGVIFFIIVSIIVMRIPQVKKILADIKEKASVGQGLVVLMKMVLCDIIVLYGNGMCFSIICWSVSGTTIDTKQFIYFINCYVLAWVVGYCIPGAPGGIGVRELVIILLIQNIVNSDLVVLTALIHRVITIIGDALGYGISIGMKAYLKRKIVK